MERRGGGVEVKYGEKKERRIKEGNARKKIDDQTRVNREKKKRRRRLRSGGGCGVEKKWRRYGGRRGGLEGRREVTAL